jgi:hypothetical protein
MRIEDLIKRVDELIALGQRALTSREDIGFGPSVRADLFAELRTASLSFIESTFSSDHTYYSEFDEQVTDVSDYYTKRALGILTAIRSELAGGWVRTTRGLISAEVFADFLEMAEHLLEEDYKDPAAVMIGSVLEEHLRQMAVKYRVPTTDLRNGREVPRKAAVINADLAKAGAYNKLDEKNVTSWLDLRNKAAHGQYGEYGKGQVELLLASVRDFIGRHSV